GRKILKLEPVFKRLVESGEDREVLAASFQHFLAEGLAIIAVEEARESGIDSICVSGGVCYNRQILETIKQRVEDEGPEFYTNSEVPPGDGGLALGQAYSQKF
ncbi:MAG: carbamoyltransferase HypF, partial [Candidatus Nanohaloarchaea archaeon]